jgi:hypothetical protein
MLISIVFGLENTGFGVKGRNEGRDFQISLNSLFQFEILWYTL